MNLNNLNTLTKYPSIETYHKLDSRGRAQDGLFNFQALPHETLYVTEKIDGVNSRIILMPDEDFLLGSREELLTARGDRIANPALGIVEALMPLCSNLVGNPKAIQVFYFETFGGKVTAQSRNYTSNQAVSVRLFDIAIIEDYQDLLKRDKASIARWRDNGGQKFLTVDELASTASRFGLELVPHLFSCSADQIPYSVDDVRKFLKEVLSETQVALDSGARKKPEGIIIRNAERTKIAKLRNEDYRT